LVIAQGTVQHYLLGLLAIGNNVSALGAFLAMLLLAALGLDMMKSRQPI
jgi:hypothetical protein